jgi:hypothetical protein
MYIGRYRAGSNYTLTIVIAFPISVSDMVYDNRGKLIACIANRLGFRIRKFRLSEKAFGFFDRDHGNACARPAQVYSAL